MQTFILSLLVLLAANPDPGVPKATKTPPMANAKKKWPKLTPETKAAIELMKIKPLPHIEAAKKVKTTIGEIKRVDEVAAFRLTPREPWHEGAYLNFIGANVFVGTSQPDIEPSAVLSGNRTWSSYFHVSFPVREGWAYVLDCQITGTTSIFLNRGGAGEEPVSLDGGNLVLGLGRSSASGNAQFLVSSERAFRMSGCEVIPAQ